jgi:hypothetical protein
MKNKGVIKFNPNDIFYTSNFKGTAMFTGFVKYFNIQRDSRYVGIAFDYLFARSFQLRSVRSKGGVEEEKSGWYFITVLIISF